MKIREAIYPPGTAGAILECLGLPPRPPRHAPARGDLLDHVIVLTERHLQRFLACFGS